MREAVIVSTARTPLTKSHRGEFNITPGPTLAAFAVKAAVERAGIDPALIEDAILGCGYPASRASRRFARAAPPTAATAAWTRGSSSTSPRSTWR